MPLLNPRVELPLLKNSVAWAFGEMPPEANGNGVNAVTSPIKYGKDAWDDIPKYMSSRAPRANAKDERVKFANDSGVPAPDSQEANGPPNYKPSIEPSNSCGACKNFQQGQCAKFGAVVNQNYTCDGFEPKVDPSQVGGFSSIPVTPVAPLQPGQSMDIPGLDKISAFKYGFLLRCAEEGLSEEQIKERIDLAEEVLEKKAILGPLLLGGGAFAGGAAGGLINAAPMAAAAIGAGAVGVPYFLGKTVARGQHGSEKARTEKFLEGNKVNIQDYQNIELINEYRRQIEELKSNQSMVDRQNAPQSRSKSYF